MIKSVNMAKQIVLTVANKIGVLADMSRLTAEHGINIQAVAGYASGNEAKIMLVTDDNLRASEALRKAGYKSLKEEEVVIVDLEDKPGALKIVTSDLAKEGIDIKFNPLPKGTNGETFTYWAGDLTPVDMNRDSAK